MRRVKRGDPVFRKPLPVLSLFFTPMFTPSRQDSTNSKLNMSDDVKSVERNTTDPSEDRRSALDEPKNAWRPFVLTPWIPAALCVLLVLAGIGLEIAYKLTVQNNGWPLPPNPTNRDSIHYVYTWIPILFIMFIVTVFATADHFIMKMVPYVDLARAGGAPGETLLIDYTGQPKFLVWAFQIRDRHFVAALSTVLLLLLMVLQPLASSLFVIKDTQVQKDPISVPKFGTVGLNETLSTLQGFASAAGFTEADARYDIGRPPFVWQSWAVDEFERPTAATSNGTMTALTTGIQTLPNCAAAEQLSFTTVAGVTQLTGSSQGCTVSLNLGNSADNLFGADVTRNCTAADIAALDDPIKPVHFWFASPAANPPTASLVFCRPQLSLHNVTITVNLANGNLINVQPNADLAPPNNVAARPPFNGHALNGVEFNVTGASVETILRGNATQLQLPASMLQMMERGDLATVLRDPAQVVNITSNRYQLFLALSARSNYFVSETNGVHLLVSILEIQQRLWMSSFATHAMAVVMIVCGILAGFVHFTHYRQRSTIKLFAPPGSIAVAASATQDSAVHGIIKNGWDEKRFRSALVGQTFGMDSTGRIVAVGNELH